MNNKPVLEVCLSPALLHLYDLENTIVVIIDIFRATSTICAALDNGAKKVVPMASPEACFAYNEEDSLHITAGERDGKVIPGMDYGNSPLEYHPEIIKNKTLVLTTTNGTKLLHMAKEAEKIIIGSFLNLDAVCDFLTVQNKKVLLACSAWKDKVNMEDTLFAGAVAYQIQDHFSLSCDSSKLCIAIYQQAREQESLLDFMKGSSHYKRLTAFGHEEDLKYCTSINTHPVLPIYNGKELVNYHQLKIQE